MGPVGPRWSRALAGGFGTGMAHAQTTKTTQSASAPAATSKQLRFLRTLAEQTGTSFTPPATTHEASREIKRLQALQSGRTPEQRRLERDTARQERHEISAARRGDNAQIRDDELSGHGSTATWNRQVPDTEPIPSYEPVAQPGGTNPMREVGRYSCNNGLERVLYGQRVHGKVRVYDKPADHEIGRSYLIDGHVTSRAELDGLVADYLKQATAMGTCPMRLKRR